MPRGVGTAKSEFLCFCCFVVVVCVQYPSSPERGFGYIRSCSLVGFLM